MPTEEIVVLANSRKPGGRCVAGISMGSGRWIRPVSGHASTGALSPNDCSVNGRMVEALDVVRFGLVRPLDDPAQPENVLIDGSAWELTGRISPRDAYRSLYTHLAPGPGLLGGTDRGVADAVAQGGMDASLALIEPNEITFRAQDNPFKRARQARAVFEFGSHRYDLGITDRIVAPMVKGWRTAPTPRKSWDFRQPIRC